MLTSRAATAIVGVVVLIGLLLTAVPLAFAEKGDVDVDLIYYGSVAGAEKIACLSYEKVYAATPEYKEIKKRKLTQNDAEYWALMEKVMERFDAAVRKVAADNGYDLIGEVGFIEGMSPKNITSQVIKAVKEQLKNE